MNAFDRGTADRACRLDRDRSAPRAASARALVFLACAAVGACASHVGSGEEAVWREGTVRAVVSMRFLDAAVPVCGSPAREAASRLDERVAIVRSRVGKASYDEAFVLATGVDVREGSDVRFERVGCTLRQRLDPARA